LIQQKALTQPFAVPSTNDRNWAQPTLSPGSDERKLERGIGSTKLTTTKDHGPFNERSIVVPGRANTGEDQMSELDHWKERLSKGAVSRREFIERAAALGASSLAISQMLASAGSIVATTLAVTRS
jgi:hypothetical protein